VTSWQVAPWLDAPMEVLKKWPSAFLCECEGQKTKSTKRVPPVQNYIQTKGKNFIISGMTSHVPNGSFGDLPHNAFCILLK
jgi:hypothetical protein